MGSVSWKPARHPIAAPMYLGIADALAADIRSGTLPAGFRLPPQRALADALGIDFTTVTRAYAEARRRGLVEGRVGQGTYVIEQRPPVGSPLSSGVIDMSMNLPSRFDDPALAERMWKSISTLSEGGLDLLLRYQEPGGTAADRQAGAAWLAPRLEGVSVDRILVCPGAQSALLAVLGAIAAPGDAICAEALAYPGLRSLAGYLRLQILGMPMDGEGIIPAGLEELCRRQVPKAIYCNPTLHNPTATTLSLERRLAVADIARRYGIHIIEDDAYGFLPQDGPPPMAALAPERVFHIAGLAKHLSPAIRVAYLALPSDFAGTRIVASIRATTSMGSPLGAAIASRWIGDGTADAILDAIRAETRARQDIAKRVLPKHTRLNRDASHVWLELAPPWTRVEFASRMQAAGVAVVTSDAFALGTPPEAVRLSLGAPSSRTELERSLRWIADMVRQTPDLTRMVV